MGSAGLGKLALAIKAYMNHLERSYSSSCCSVSDSWSILIPPHAFTCICGNAIHCHRHGICRSREACMFHKDLNEAFGNVIQGYAVQFPIFGPLSTHPPAFTCICGNAIHYDCDWDGVCGSREACMCNKGLNEAFGEKLFKFMLFILSLITPTPTKL